MTPRSWFGPTLTLLAAASLAVPFGLHPAYSEGGCPPGTEPVVNTGQCATGPSRNIVRNKVGKLMDLDVCTTYRGREYDEIEFHNTTAGASGATAQFDSSNDREVGPTGDIWLMVDDGSIVSQPDPTTTLIDTVDVVRKLYTRRADVYDFLAIFPNFNHAEGSFHNFIKNDVQGINVPIQDNSATYGTHNLKSLTLYRNFNGFPGDVNARIPGNNDSTMSLLAQETGHRWGAYVRRDSDLSVRIKASTDLLGRNLTHWCFYHNVPSAGPAGGFSSMEGNFWSENVDGSFTTVAQSDGYSVLDQYLMGFRAPNSTEVFFRLDPGGGNIEPDCAHRPFTPGEDAPWTFFYPRISFTVDDIIRVEGPRVPDSLSSQKNWRMAFILLVKQGTSPTQAQIDKLENIRVAWDSYFDRESGGGLVFTALGPIDADEDTYLSNLDCNDNDEAIHPGAAELCNFTDDDCDGLIDDGFDADGDLYTTCNNDCNDGNIAVNPAASEVWNGLDDNCDGVIDNVNLIDVDGDGFYTNPSDPAQADCNDESDAVNPGAVEIANGIDDNCNGFVDCADPTVFRQSDSGPRGHDGIDNDCNGVIDG